MKITELHYFHISSEKKWALSLLHLLLSLYIQVSPGKIMKDYFFGFEGKAFLDLPSFIYCPNTIMSYMKTGEIFRIKNRTMKQFYLPGFKAALLKSVL